MKQDLWFSAKDTISKTYDHRFKDIFAEVYEADYKRAFEEAGFYRREHPTLPLAYCMATTCDGAEPLLLMLRAEDGQAFIQHATGDPSPLYLKLGLDRLLPKLQFVYDI